MSDGYDLGIKVGSGISGYLRATQQQQKTTIEWIREYQTQLQNLNAQIITVEKLLEEKWQQLEVEEAEIHKVLEERRNKLDDIPF
jgi:hypothetical protein